MAYVLTVWRGRRDKEGGKDGKKKKSKKEGGEDEGSADGSADADEEEDGEGEVRAVHSPLPCTCAWRDSRALGGPCVLTQHVLMSAFSEALRTRSRCRVCAGGRPCMRWRYGSILQWHAMCRLLRCHRVHGRLSPCC